MRRAFLWCFLECPWLGSQWLWFMFVSILLLRIVHYLINKETMDWILIILINIWFQYFSNILYLSAYSDIKPLQKVGLGTERYTFKVGLIKLIDKLTPGRAMRIFCWQMISLCPAVSLQLERHIEHLERRSWLRLSAQSTRYNNNYHHLRLFPGVIKIFIQ